MLKLKVKSQYGGSLYFFDDQRKVWGNLNLHKTKTLNAVFIIFCKLGEVHDTYTWSKFGVDRTTHAEDTHIIKTPLCLFAFPTLI